ncbi:MAG TPA: hypothetical protein VEU62_15535 [Bryobacterales bacterium]|nr:hypothetical protein [Bryobacterales bacterium]
MADANIPLSANLGTRRTEDIALDLMKFIALTSGCGKTQGGAGFSGKPAARSNDEYAESLLQLYERCRQIVERTMKTGNRGGD